MSIRFINNPEENNSIRNYKFTDTTGKVKEISCPTDHPDAELIVELENTKNCCYYLKTEKAEHFFIKMEASYAFDPKQDSTSYKKRNWKYKKVVKNKYDNYIKYLKNNEPKYLKLVERI